MINSIILLISSPITIIWASLICFLVAFIFVIFVFYRQRRESFFRQTEAELGQQVAEVEMKALRSQMNPHFIFNALNSVYHFMENNDLKNAGDYLLKVSSLMRIVLENSMNKSVSIEDDLNALKIYIEIEQMRLQNSFDFVFEIDQTIDVENTFVPPLIIQPFIENAIWHGLKNRKSGGLLSIKIFKENEMLHYEINDNGKLREYESQIKVVDEVKRKSLGISITKERLELLNKTKNSNALFTLTDKFDAQLNYLGKKVLMQLPLEEM